MSGKGKYTQAIHLPRNSNGESCKVASSCTSILKSAFQIGFNVFAAISIKKKKEPKTKKKETSKINIDFKKKFDEEKVN